MNGNEPDNVTRVPAAPAPTEQRSERIGPYRVVSELGVGGMGTVLLAERELGDTRQKVALKLIRGFPTHEARERLARERNLLAGLNHPNIAGLLDAGETADHVPYLAMEYVEGVPLREFCARHELDLAARLRLFGQLCGAVQHAHQRLVVHRDIKPGNVLVREDGTPVLLDFGIGKLLDVTAPDATATRVFTPAYAAPEQRSGRSVTTATDIYGLGCVLYELLSERSLHELGEAGQFPLPSAAARDPARARALRGELDTLIGKAMHLEPERRYASAQALADDVENYLTGRPLRAAPDSLAYRLRKFVARHRYAAVAGMLFALLVAVFVWRLNAERQRALAAETHAEREAQSTRRSRDFLVRLFESASPNNTLDHALTARELIDQGSRKLREELQDEPETSARLGLTIAEVYATLGDPKAAIANGERALALVPGDTPDAALLRSEILMTLATEYDNTERFSDARKATDDALALRERYAQNDPASVAASLTESAAAAVRRGDQKMARTLFDRAIAMYAKARNVEPLDRAEVLRGLAELDNQQGHFADSLANAEKAVRALEALPEGSPARIDFWRMLATAQIANAKPLEATKTLEQALQVARTALGEDSYKVAEVENDIAVALNGVGRYRDAIPHLQRSIDITVKLRPGDRAATALSLLNLAALYENVGDYPRAEKLEREGLAAIEAETPDEPQLDFLRGNLARTLMFRGDIAGARAENDRALAGIEAREGKDSFSYAGQLFRRARIELVGGDLDAAEHFLADSLRVIEPALPAEHSMHAHIAALRGMIAKARGDLDGARKQFEAAEATMVALNQSDPMDLAIVRMRLGGVLAARGELAAARAKLDAAQPTLDTTLLPQANERAEMAKYRAELVDREAALKK